MIKIYIHGCECGVDKHCTSKVKKYALDKNQTVEVYDTRLDQNRLQEHISYLDQNSISSYTGIVVENGKVTSLRSWLTA